MQNGVKIAVLAKPCDAESLDDVIAQVEKYGRPVITKLDSGWRARVSIFATGRGVEFDVASEFGHATARNAVIEMRDRLVDAIKSITAGGNS